MTAKVKDFYYLTASKAWDAWKAKTAKERSENLCKFRVDTSGRDNSEATTALIV